MGESKMKWPEFEFEGMCVHATIAMVAGCEAKQVAMVSKEAGYGVEGVHGAGTKSLARRFGIETGDWIDIPADDFLSSEDVVNNSFVSVENPDGSRHLILKWDGHYLDCNYRGIEYLCVHGVKPIRYLEIKKVA